MRCGGRAGGRRSLPPPRHGIGDDAGEDGQCAADDDGAERPVDDELAAPRNRFARDERHPGTGAKPIGALDFTEGDQSEYGHDREARRYESPQAIEPKDRREPERDPHVQKEEGRTGREHAHRDGETQLRRARALALGSLPEPARAGSEPADRSVHEGLLVSMHLRGLACRVQWPAVTDRARVALDGSWRRGMTWC